MVIPSVATFDVLSHFHLTVYVAYLKRVFICSLPMLYVCESCLKYIKSCNILQRHLVSYYWLQCLSRYSAAANAVAASFHYNAALPRRPHYTLHSVCLSVCHMPTVNSKMENRSTFKLTEEATHIAGNWKSNFYLAGRHRWWQKCENYFWHISLENVSNHVKPRLVWPHFMLHVSPDSTRVKMCTFGYNRATLLCRRAV